MFLFFLFVSGAVAAVWKANAARQAPPLTHWMFKEETKEETRPNGELIANEDSASTNIVLDLKGLS